MKIVNVLDSYSLYLHIPFCGTRCTYCAFNTYTHSEALIPAYVEALCSELSWLGAGQPVHTVYFGGGTPSLLSPAQVDQILGACCRAFDVAPNCEITLEANPGSVDGDYFAIETSFRGGRLGLARVSVGLGEGERLVRVISVEVRAAPACR